MKAIKLEEFRNKLERVVTKGFPSSDGTHLISAESLLDYIDMNEIDVEPVLHGYWKIVGPFIVCSRCCKNFIERDDDWEKMNRSFIIAHIAVQRWMRSRRMKPINRDYLLSKLFDMIRHADGDTLLAYKKVLDLILDTPVINLDSMIESQKWNNDEAVIKWRMREDHKIAEEYRKPKGGMDNGGDW